MHQNANFLNSKGCNLSSDESLSKLYHATRPRVKRIVHLCGITGWRGQEYDIIEDHVQEAVIRTWEFSQQASRGEARPLRSPEAMCMTIAHHYSIDRMRQSRRFIRLEQNNYAAGVRIVRKHQVNPLEAVIDKTFEESLLLMLPSAITEFPDKQRRALLIDLANRMDFDGDPTPLQEAFLRVGVQLQDYQLALPEDPVELSRHRSLVSIAYKRVANLTCVKQYISAA
jgi:DNA-directed RNA polymerase specialized sigma24 family protein